MTAKELFERLQSMVARHPNAEVMIQLENDIPVSYIDFQDVDGTVLIIPEA